MFELLFKYPRAVFSKGTFVLLAGWPLWLLGAGMAAAALVLAWLVWRRARGSEKFGVVRASLAWLLQTALAAMLVDDSASMAVADEGGSTRKDRALAVLNSGLMNGLQGKFQVRIYKMSDHLDRIDKLEQITAQAHVTHIGPSLKQVVEDSSGLPIGAVVLLSDGADNSGGVDLETLSEFLRARIPVHTIGFGREKMAHDLEITDVELAQRTIPNSRLAATVHFHQAGYAGQKVRINVSNGSKVLASQEVTLKGDGVEQVEPVLFNVGDAGVKTVEVAIAPLAGEENPRNNRLTRLINV